MRKFILLFFLLTVTFSNISFAKDMNQKKKVVVIKDDDGEYFNGLELFIKELFKQNGWTDHNSEFISLSLEGKESKKAEVIQKIKSIKPDVVLINAPQIKDLALALSEENIPFVSGGGLELTDQNNNLILVDKNGFPTQNITGTYTIPTFHLENSFYLLNEISPLKGKKVVFATSPSPAFTKEKVEAALDINNIELKEFKKFTFIEDYIEFVEKYNNDPEVGWIVSGEMIARSKTNKSFSFEDFYEVERTNNTKPNIAFWEVSVQNGELCGLAIDSLATVHQMVAMANSILCGTRVNQIKPEDPARTSLMLNQMRALELGVEFDVEILGDAWKVYTDYDGSFIARE